MHKDPIQLWVAIGVDRIITSNNNNDLSSVELYHVIFLIPCHAVRSIKTRSNEDNINRLISKKSLLASPLR